MFFQNFVVSNKIHLFAVTSVSQHFVSLSINMISLILNSFNLGASLNVGPVLIVV